MLGYSVTKADGTVRNIEADHYEVESDGTLLLYDNARILEAFEAETWVQVQDLGTRLAAVWPPLDLAHLLDTVATRLGLHYGHYVHGLRDPGLFSDWRLNDFSSLTERLLDAAELDSTDSECRAETTDVRLAIAKHFGLNR